MAPKSVEAYLEGLPPARREALAGLRTTILENLPPGYEEGIQYGAIGYYVPHSICPDGYHTDPSQPVPFIGLASKKSGMTLNFFGVYVDSDAKELFVSAWKKSGQPLDMGAACVRFKKLEDVPLDVVAEAVSSMPVDVFLEKYEAIVPARLAKKRSYGKGS